jgi:hypothetical protein
VNPVGDDLTGFFVVRKKILTAGIPYVKELKIPNRVGLCTPVFVDCHRML